MMNALPRPRKYVGGLSSASNRGGAKKGEWGANNKGVRSDQIPDPLRHNADGSPACRVRYTHAEAAEQTRMIEACMTQGMTTTAIYRTLRTRWPNFGRTRLGRFIEEINTRWSQETRERARSEREAAIRRGYAHLTRAIQVPAGQAIDTEMIRFAEQHLAKILGLYAAQKLEVTEHTQMLGEALRFMTPDQITDLRTEYRATLALAQKAKAAGLK
jgi:hypothetical protein